MYQVKYNAGYFKKCPRLCPVCGGPRHKNLLWPFTRLRRKPRVLPVDECEKGIRRSFSAGGCASAGFAEDGGATGYARGAP